MAPLTWIKKFVRIVREHDAQIAKLQAELEELRAIHKERTTVSMDVAYSRKDQSTVILVGRYQRQDYVRVFNVHPSDFTDLVRTVRNMERNARLDRFDAPIDVKAVIDWEMS